MERLEPLPAEEEVEKTTAVLAFELDGLCGGQVQ
jgi:hypothetical protein